MAAMPLLECSFLIPIRRDAEISDGTEHRKAAWKWLHNELIREFQGWSRLPGSCEGEWMSPAGTRISDQSKRYFVALAKSRLPALRSVLKEACRVFHQQAIYLAVEGKVEFLEVAHHEQS
jgi:hypothetical protein